MAARKRKADERRELLDEARDAKKCDEERVAKADASKMTPLQKGDPLLAPREIPRAADKAKIAIVATRKQAAHHSLAMQLHGWVEHPCRMSVVSSGDGKDVHFTWSHVYFRRVPGKKRALIVMPILYAAPKISEDGVVDPRPAKEWLSKAAPLARVVVDSEMRDLAWIASLNLSIDPSQFHFCDSPSDDLWDWTDPVLHPPEYVAHRWQCDHGQS